MNSNGSDLFEEPGTLEEVEQLAGDWFLRYLAPQTDLSGKEASS